MNPGVLVRGQFGALHVLEYQMIPAGEGWQINAVRILKGDGFTA